MSYPNKPALSFRGGKDRNLPVAPWLDFAAPGTASRGTCFARRLRHADAACIDEQTGDLVGPVKQPCESSHDRHATKADQELHRDAMRVLNQDPVRSKGKEHAEAKN